MSLTEDRYALSVKKFIKDTSNLDKLVLNKFYVSSRYGDWQEVDKIIYGLDVSWAFHKSPEANFIQAMYLIKLEERLMTLNNLKVKDIEYLYYIYNKSDNIDKLALLHRYERTILKNRKIVIAPNNGV